MKKWTIFLAVVLGCAGSKSRPDCPVGYMWANDVCTKQVDINFGQDRQVKDDGQTVDKDAPVARDSKTDVRPKDANAPVTIGAACKIASDCEGISTETGCVPDTESDAGCVHYNSAVECLNNDAWKDGYCALRDCLSEPCPNGAECVAVGPKVAWCVAPCKQDSDCRTAEGYNCKAVLNSAGALTRACLPSGKGDTGDACTMYTDCRGGMDCLTSIKNGYCAKRACSKDSACAEGAACVELNEGTACMKSCKVDIDCNVGDITGRSCSKLHSGIPDGDMESVCVAGKGGKKVGDACTQDYECATNDCRVVYRGVCKDTTNPCNSTSDCDARVCDTTDPKNILGYCSKDCREHPASCGSTSHSGPAVCIETSDGFMCMPACVTQPCTVNHAMECAYGFAKSGQGLNNYCMPLPKPGDWGTFCTQDAGCHNNSQFPECLKGSGEGYGYCTGIPRVINGERKCPFPLQNVKISPNRHLCLKYCRTGDDCRNLPGKPGVGAGKTALECKLISGNNFCIIPTAGSN